MNGNEFAEITFSQLWETEKSMLAALASKVPANGVIVEIGTAQGGSSYIISKATKGREVNILSFDIATSPEALQHLANTNVKLYTMSSVEGANRWGDLCGEEIDLLLVDGSHAFQHVFEDIQMWIPLMRPGGILIFHDYDSDERGGLVHFGTEVALKALLQTPIISNPVHSDRFLYGRVDNTTNLKLSLKTCLDVFKNIACGINRLAVENFSSWNLIGHESFARVLSASININVSMVSSSLENISEADRFLIFERPLYPLFEKISEYRVPPENYLFINNMQACYLLEKGLQENRDILLGIAANRNKYFRIEEKIFMFNHAFGYSKFPNQVNDLTVVNEEELSVIIAREQIRLGLLAELFEALLGWKP
jgi:hypothetical protein